MFSKVEIKDTDIQSYLADSCLCSCPCIYPFSVRKQFVILLHQKTLKCLMSQTEQLFFNLKFV